MNHELLAIPAAISVLMPVLNPHPVFFPLAVQSILSQTHGALELVIVEDPSANSGAELLRTFIDPRIRHIRNLERTSLVCQLNQGIRESRYDLIARMDADDIAHPDRIAKQIDYLHVNPEVDVLGSHLDIIGVENELLGIREYPLDHESILKTMPIYNCLAHPTIVYRKSKLAEVGGYHEARTEDYDLWSRLAKARARFANYPEALLDYRVHTASFKANRLRETIRGTLEVKRKYWMETMTLRGRLRMLGERAMLQMPANLVLNLFMWMYYKKK